MITCSECGSHNHKKDFHLPNPQEKYCKGCELILPIDKFYQYLRKSGKPWWTHYCKKCNVKTNSEYNYASFEKRIASLLRTARTRNQQIDITYQDLIKQLNQQKYKCFYLGIPLSIQRGKFSLSIDRIDSSKGYVKNNIVLCCWIVNQMKRDIPYKTFIELCGQIKKNSKVLSV